MVFDVRDFDEGRIADALDFCVAAGTPPDRVPAQRAESERWVRGVLEEWSPCGKLGYFEDALDGLLLYLPGEIDSGRSLCAHYAENPVEYPSAWREGGMVIIVCLWVRGKGRGMGTALLHRLFEEIGQGREFRGAPRRSVGVMVYHPSDEVHWPAGPMEYYRRLGFKVERLDAGGKRAWLSRAAVPLR